VPRTTSGDAVWWNQRAKEGRHPRHRRSLPRELVHQPSHRRRVPGKLRRRPVLIDVLVGDERRIAVHAADAPGPRPSAGRVARAPARRPWARTPRERQQRAPAEARGIHEHERPIADRRSPRAPARSSRPSTARRRAGDEPQRAITSRTSRTSDASGSGPRRRLVRQPVAGQVERDHAVPASASGANQSRHM
jgi:hypothetical protein